MAILYVMCGVPGVGKSTFVTKHIKDNEIYVSRDAIRYALVPENEWYFSKEKETFREFIKEIDDGINAGYNVYADATHLNPASRAKLLRNLKSHPTSIEAIYLTKDLDTILAQNELREGTRGYVPIDAIKDYYKAASKPELDEGFDAVYTVETNNKIHVIRRANS